MDRWVAFLLACALAIGCSPQTAEPSAVRTATSPATSAAATAASARPSGSVAPAPASASASRTPVVLPSNATLPELPAQPALPGGATRIASGMITVSVAPGGSEDLEAQRL